MWAHEIGGGEQYIDSDMLSVHSETSLDHRPNVTHSKMKPQSLTDTMRFCPVCAYYLFLKVEEEDEDAKGTVMQLCRHCGFKEPLAPTTSKEALVLETTFSTPSSSKQTASLMNEFTRMDPTLPRLKTIPCPNTTCASTSDISLRNILFIKTDAKNLKYQYACTVCGTQWGS